jgi:hypothetical protein
MTKLESISHTPLFIGKFDSIEEAKLYYYNSELSETCIFICGIVEYIINYNEDKSKILITYVGNRYMMQVSIINEIILNAVIAIGADFCGSYQSNTQGLIDAMKKYLDTDYELRKIYEIKSEEVKDNEGYIWIIPQFILKEEFKQ